MGTDGSFELGGVAIGPGLTLEAFEASPLRPGADMQYGPEGVRARVEGSILGRTAVVQLEFSGGGLARVWVFVRLAGDGTDWSQWTLAQEMARKREHEKLAAEMFGLTLTYRPMDVNGKPVKPLFPGEDYPLHAVAAWGEVVSGYDSKAGMAQMWVAYRN